MPKDFLHRAIIILLMKAFSKYRTLPLFFAGVALSLVILTSLGALAGYSVERALEGGHSIFTYAHYVFVVGGIGGVIAVGLKKSVRIATGAGIILMIGLTIAKSPQSNTSIIHLTSRLGAASVLIFFIVCIEYSIVNYDKVRSVMTPEAIRMGALTGVAYGVFFVAARALTGSYERGLVETMTMNPSSMGVAIWSIGGLFIVGFVAGWLMRSYSLVFPLLITSTLFAIASLFTWIRFQSRGTDSTAAVDLITLFGWVWIGSLAVAVGVAVMEKELRDRFEFQRILPEK